MCILDVFLPKIFPTVILHPQRKNNLCRRLRIEKQKDKEKKKELKTLHGTGPMAVASGGETEQSFFGDSKPHATSNNAVSSESAGRPHQDSFDEDILDLPGLDGLGALEDFDFDFDFDEEKPL